jgi:hypothetical protein
VQDAPAVAGVRGALVKAAVAPQVHRALEFHAGRGEKATGVGRTFYTTRPPRRGLERSQGAQ